MVCFQYHWLIVGNTGFDFDYNEFSFQISALKVWCQFTNYHIAFKAEKQARLVQCGTPAVG